LRAVLAAGAQLILVAAGRAMDPLDPALQALDRAGGRLLKHGIAAHPGALLWLGVIGEAAVIGVPSCGIASRATALDLLLPWLFTGERPSRERLAALGTGGMLTRESAFRLPPYRRPGARGELDPA
jgi:molybdopterin biosynthesis enzyme